MSKNTRILFSKAYYTLQAILNSKKFEKLFEIFKEEMESKGFGMPVGGFKTATDFHEWRENAYRKSIYPDGFINKMIKEFGVEKDKDKIVLGLQWYVYFGKKIAPIESTHKKLSKVTSDGETIGVSLTIYPWTVKEDIVDDIWDQVIYLRKKLITKSKERNREWDTFERDFKVYELYLKLKESSQKSTYKRLVEDPEFEKIAIKYNAGKSFDESIGSIITRCTRQIHKISFL